jgi:hypothetical protein
MKIIDDRSSWFRTANTSAEYSRLVSGLRAFADVGAEFVSRKLNGKNLNLLAGISGLAVLCGLLRTIRPNIVFSHIRRALRATRVTSACTISWSIDLMRPGMVQGPRRMTRSTNHVLCRIEYDAVAVAGANCFSAIALEAGGETVDMPEARDEHRSR